MKSIVEYIENNNEILSLISEVLNNNEISNIEESFLFESKLNFNPKDSEELTELMTLWRNDKNSYEKIDEINDEWLKYLKDNNFNIDKYFHWKPFSDDFADINSVLKINTEIGICYRGGYLMLSKFDFKNKYRGDTLVQIEYDYSKPFFENFINLFHENKVIWFEFCKKGTYLDEMTFTTDKNELKDYKLIELEETKCKSNDTKNDESDTEENVKDTVTDSIKDNKDLLTPLAKAANITGEKLRDIITKVCLDKNGKARKLDNSVILGLSVMLCGVILTIKKSGKSDNAAILAVTDRISKIVKSKKSIKNNL